MSVLALDTGSAQTGWVLFDEVADRVGLDPIIGHGITPNGQLVSWFRGTALLDGEAFRSGYAYAAEWYEPRGMPTAAQEFESIFWLGRMAEALGGTVHRITRRQVKLHLCGSMKARDTNIRAALIERYTLPDRPAVGTKKAPGPLYGIRQDEWQALAVAVTWADRDRDAVAAAVDASVARLMDGTGEPSPLPPGLLRDPWATETGLEGPETPKT